MLYYYRIYRLNSVFGSTVNLACRINNISVLRNDIILNGRQKSSCSCSKYLYFSRSGEIPLICTLFYRRFQTVVSSFHLVRDLIYRDIHRAVFVFSYIYNIIIHSTFAYSILQVYQLQLTRRFSQTLSSIYGSSIWRRSEKFRQKSIPLICKHIISASIVFASLSLHHSLSQPLDGAKATKYLY